MKILELIIKIIIWMGSCVLATIIMLSTIGFIIQEYNVAEWHWLLRVILIFLSLILTGLFGGETIDKVETYFKERRK